MRPRIAAALIAAVLGGVAGWFWMAPSRSASRAAPPSVAERRAAHESVPQPIDATPLPETDRSAPPTEVGHAVRALPPDDARTEPLPENRWWEEREPAARATGLAAALEPLDGAGKAELIARAMSADPMPEVREVAAAQVVADVLGGSERPMTAEERAACCKALLAALAPSDPIEARRQVVASVLAGGAADQVRALSAYLEGREPDRELRDWGLDLARRILAAGGSRDDDVMRALVAGIESGR